MAAKFVPLTGHGRIKVNVPVQEWGVSGEFAVLASVTEMGHVNGNFQPFVGAADVEIHNLAPQPNGSVDVVVDILWNTDLNVRVTLVLV